MLFVEETKKQIKELMQRLMNFVRNLERVLVAINLEGRIVGITKNTENLFGCNAQWLLDRSLEMLVSDCSVTNLKQMINETIQKKSKNMIFRVLMKRFERMDFFAEINMVVVQDDNGKIIGLVGIISDSTKTSREKDHSIMQLQILSDSSLDAMIMMNESGIVTFWNRSAEKIFGYEKKEIIGQDLHMHLVSSEDYPFFKEKMDKYTLTGDGGAIGKTIELLARRKDGTKIFIELSLSKVFLDCEWQYLGIVRDITEKKIAQECLKKSEEKFYKAFNSSPDSIVITSIRTSEILEVNEGFERMSGYSRGEAIGKTTLNAKLWANEKDRYLCLQLLRENGKVRERDFCFRNRLGEILECKYSAEVIDLHGEKCVISTIRDITVQKQAERLAKAEYELVSALAKNLPLEEILENFIDHLIGLTAMECVGLYIHDHEACRLDLICYRGLEHDFLKRVKTYEKDATNYQKVMSGQVIYKFKHDFDLESKCLAEKFGLKSIAVLPVKYREEIVGCLNVGSKIIEDVNEFVKMALEKISLQIGMVISETQKRQIAQEREQKYKILFNTTNDALFLVGEDGYFLDANHIAVEKYEYILSDLLEMNLTNISCEEYVGLVMEKLECILEKGCLFEWVLKTKSGVGVPVEICTRPIVLDGCRCSYLEARDITDRKRVLEERLENERKMLHVQQLESLGVMAGGIAHDFNNILSIIMGFAELTLMHLPEDKSILKYNLEKIISASRRASDLCKQMLIYSGKGVYEIIAINVNDLINETMELVRSYLSKKAILKVNLEIDLPSVKGDKIQIHQVMMNLIINASEALEDKVGEIIISTKLVYVDNDQDLSIGQYILIEVIDTGCGMDKKTMEKMFDPFYSTKSLGRGLGMSTVMTIVKSHNGLLKVESEKMHGTTFRLYLPVNNEKISSKVDSKKRSYTELKGKTILLVDDEEGVQELGKEFLVRMGCNTILAKDGVEACEKYSQFGEKIDTVILDLSMPRMDGKEASKIILSKNPEAKILIASGYTEYDLEGIFEEYKNINYIEKPYSFGILADKLKNILK